MILKISLILETISKKPIFLFKNIFTSTSLAALTIVGVKTPNVKHLLINFIDGNCFTSTFLKLNLLKILASIFLIFKILFLLHIKYSI